MKRLVAFALLIAAAAQPAAALTISGMAQVVRPYAFNLEGYEVYMVGVDSVEVRQGCSIDGRPWECWAAAQRQLETILSEGPVTCESVSGPDANQRVIATCIMAGEDVGERYIRTGFGIAIPEETERYRAADREARASFRGLWQGTFAPPAIFRALPLSPKSTRPDFTPSAPIE